MKKLVNLVSAALVVAALAGCYVDSTTKPPVTGTTAGTVISTGIKIGNTTYEKTSEVSVIPAGTTASITKTDDSSWSSYCDSNADSRYKGVFLKDRKVKLSPFVMSQYEVTQELYEAVMGTNPSSFKSNPDGTEKQSFRPVESVTHYQAVAFCNELTKKTMADSDVVYYSDAGFASVYTKDDASNYKTPYMNTAKKGYRLPTEAEWEFAARGGDSKKAAWNYAYAGKTIAGGKISSYPSADTNLADVAWYTGNSISKTHQVGLKTANALGLFDMSGNVWEWCWDWYNSTATSNDSAYTTDDTVVDPLGASSGSYRVDRGGSWSYDAYFCSVSFRDIYSPDFAYYYLGFRVCRSVQ